MPFSLLFGVSQALKIQETKKKMIKGTIYGVMFTSLWCGPLSVILKESSEQFGQILLYGPAYLTIIWISLSNIEFESRNSFFLALTLVFNCLFMPFIIFPLSQINFFGSGLMSSVSDFILIVFSLLPALLTSLIFLVFLIKKGLNYIKWMKKRTNTQILI